MNSVEEGGKRDALEIMLRRNVVQLVGTEHYPEEFQIKLSRAAKVFANLPEASYTALYEILHQYKLRTLDLLAVRSISPEMTAVYDYLYPDGVRDAGAARILISLFDPYLPQIERELEKKSQN